MAVAPYPPPRLSWTVWGLGALFYFTGFYQRVAPAVMADHLMADFHLDATALGHFSAFYFYSYVAMQIPTGILADHWGARKLLTAGALVATLGTLLFATAPNHYLANLGRLLIGGSVAVAWVTLLKLSIHWFPPRFFSTVSGIALLAGVAGAVSAGVPLRFLLERFGWRPVMGLLGLASFGLAVGIWLAVRNDPSERGYRSYAPPVHSTPGSSFMRIAAGLGRVLRYRNTWLLTLAPGALAGSVLAFCGLWGVPYLTVRFGLDQARSAAITSAVMVAWALGGPILGALSDRIGRRRWPYLAAILAATLGWAAALYWPELPLAWFVVILVTAGFFSGSLIITFAFVKESVPPELAGTVSGVSNMGVMAGPMILQPLIGWVLDRHWQGTLVNGVRSYDLQAYQAGFIPILVWLILCAAMIFVSHETHCRQQHVPLR